MSMELSEVQTDINVDDLASDIATFISEMREWEDVCNSIAKVMDDVEGALTAQDYKGAIEDALANMRLLDWSSPTRMELLLPHTLDKIENRLDELLGDINADPALRLPFSVGVNGESPILLRRFATEREATEFVGNLEGADDGRYYLDGPER